jgi:hypothetical protein
MRGIGLSFGLSLWLNLGLSVAGAPQPLDRVLASVDHEVITASQMLAEIRVALLLRAGVEAARQARLPAAANDAPLPQDAAANRLAEQLQAYVIDQQLVASQVRRQGISQISDAEVEERLGGVVRLFSDEAAYQNFLSEFGLSEELLVQILRRDLAGDRFISSRLAPRAAAAAAPAGDLSGAAEASLLPQPSGSPVSWPKPEVLHDWLAQLRQHVEIRLLNAAGRLELQSGARR